MATFDAGRARAVALEVKDNAVALYTSILSIYRAAVGWTLNGLDPDLPTPLELRAQVAAYRALTVTPLRLTAWGEAFLLAGTGDTLTYPPPGALSGQIQFDEISFEHLTF
jgi:hypothetical protein